MLEYMKKNKAGMLGGLAGAMALGAGTYLMLKMMKEKKERKSVGKVRREYYMDPGYKEHIDLSLSESERRHALISDVAYTAALSLPMGDVYEGFIRTTFKLADISDAVFIDFFGHEVSDISINGQDVLPQDVFRNQRILLPEQFQRKGRNELSIRFRNVYATNGFGIHTFKDPEDGQQYLYSHCEAFRAHKMFPMFDQPDLKATLKVITLTPKEWVTLF
jgi:aminopeptidase N